jgi:SAM-dependent methyltransferase
VQALLASEQIAPASLPPGTDVRTNVPNWVGVPYKGATSDVVFFKLLGVTDIQALDYSDFETAEIVHDLNQPLPEELTSRFDLVLDSGTTEHVFDVRRVLMNIASLLKPGGRVIHISPTNNYVNHGFFQFSPTMFFDYYGVNGFTDLRGFIVEHDTYLSETKPWKVYELTTDVEHLTSVQSLLVVFIAEKTAASTIDKIPLQSSYKRMYESLPGAKNGHAEIIKQMLPHRAKAFLKKNVPGMGTMKRPWGLKRLGRLK